MNELEKITLNKLEAYMQRDKKELALDLIAAEDCLRGWEYDRYGSKTYNLQPSQIRCPKCESSDIKYKTNETFTCKKCGHVDFKKNFITLLESDVDKGCPVLPNKI